MTARIPTSRSSRSPAPPPRRADSREPGWLAERGETIVGSGCFRAGQVSGSIHTDFGPEDQDKDANQDYALAWLPHDPNTATVSVWPCAGRRLDGLVPIGIGLGPGRSVALRALVAGDPGLAPRERARDAFDEAGRSLGRLSDELARDPESSCPAGQFVSTWKYILRKGVLFQSTLTLAWLDPHCFRVAILEDGGAVWRSYQRRGGGRRPRTASWHSAISIGTRSRPSVRPTGTCGRSTVGTRKRRRPVPLRLHTDGVGRGLGRNPAALLDKLEEIESLGPKNASRLFIEKAIHARPRDFDDNLTLAVIRAE